MNLSRLIFLAALAASCLACVPAHAKAITSAQKTALWAENFTPSGSKLSAAPQSPDFAMENEGCGYETAMGLAYWLNRDPIGERGGINLYGMVGNDAVNRWDLLGLSPIDPGPCGNCGVTIYVGHNTHVVEILKNRENELRKTPNACMSYGSVSCTTCRINHFWEERNPDNSVDGLGEALRNFQARDPANTVSAGPDPSKMPDQDGGFLGAMRTARQKAIEEAKQLCGKSQCKCEKVTISIELIDVSDPAKDDNGFVKNLKNPAWDSYFSPTEYNCKTGAVKTTLVRR